MSHRPLRIGHLFPDLLNLYADRGNILTLTQRLQWRGYDVIVDEITHADTPRFGAYDLVLLGGGSDREQMLVAGYLANHRTELRHAVEDGLPLLAICGGYQLLGAYYQVPSGEKIPGLELIDMVTNYSAGQPRLIGNVAILTEEAGVVMGFENHGGRTIHQGSPLGKVIQGHGNDGVSGLEGIRYRNVWGTYIHGPLLPKNPRLADAILRTMLQYAGIDDTLDPLDDRMEEEARRSFVKLRMPEVEAALG